MEAPAASGEPPAPRRPAQQHAPMRPPSAAAPRAFSACLRKSLVLSTRGARAGPSDRAGPGGVLAWRALTQAALVAAVFWALRSADSGPAPVPARAFPAAPLGLPVWAADYQGPGRRRGWRGTVAVAPGGPGRVCGEDSFDSATTALAAALACGWGSADGRGPGAPTPAASPDPGSRSFRSMWRRPARGAAPSPRYPDPVAAVCDGGGAPCAAERACWVHLLTGPSPPASPPPPGLVPYASWEAALAAVSAFPDAFDAVAALGWGCPPGAGAGPPPRYALAANSTLLPPGARAPPGSAAALGGGGGSALDAPSPHKAAWFLANLQAALEGAAGAGPRGSQPAPVPLLFFKPFPAPPARADATALLVGALLQLAVAYAALAPGRRAASALAAEAGAQRAALAGAGLPGRTYWVAWAAAHALEAGASAAAFGCAAALAVPARAAVLAAALAGAATAAVVAAAYVAAASLGTRRGPTAAADAFTACYVLAALPGYVAPSLPPGSVAAVAAWTLARALPPSSAVLAGAGAGAAAGAARGGGGWAAMLGSAAAPGGAGGPGAPTVGGVLACLALQAVCFAVLAAGLEAAGGARRGPGALPRKPAAVSAGDAEAGPPDPYPPGPAAEAATLVKVYGGGQDGAAPVTALAGLDLTAPHGRVTALLGPSGAGKTTAIACLTGETAPTSGAARMGGVDAALTGEAGVSVGVCPQTDVSWPALTVREHLELWSAVKGADTAREAARDAARAAAAVGLGPKLDARASELSGGQRRALAAAAALVRGPDVVVLDEPTAGLDAAARARVWAALASRPRGTGALVATHALEEVEAAAEHAVVIGRGVALAAGSPGDLRSAHGGGYRLAVSWGEGGGGGAEEGGAAAAVAALVARAAPGAVPSPAAATPAGTARFTLPASAAPAFPGLLRSLDDARHRLGLSGVALAVAPLEDAVGALTAEAEGEGEGGGGPEAAEGGDEGAPPASPRAALRPTSLPDRTPPGVSLACARIGALARTHWCAARARAGAEVWGLATGAGAVALGAYLAAATAAGSGSGRGGSPLGPPLPLGRAGALGGAPALVGGPPSAAARLPDLAAALGPPPAVILPSATAGPGPGGLGPPPTGSMDAALLEAWGGRSGSASLSSPAFDALYAGWPGPGSAVLFANGSAPLGLFGALASAVPALMGRAAHATPPVLVPLAPGSSALVSSVAAAAGGWVFAFELVSATSAAAGAAARRAAAGRPPGGPRTQTRLAGAGVGVTLAAAGAAEAARVAAWLGGGLALTAVLGPPDLAAPRSLAALALLGFTAAAASVAAGWAGARGPATPDPDAAALAPGRWGWAGVGAFAGVGGLRFAPLLLPAHAKALKAAANTLHWTAVALLPPYNLLRGVLAVALVEDQGQAGLAGGGVSLMAAGLSALRRLRRPVTPHPAPLAWNAAGQALACLAGQVVGFTLAAAWAESRPEGEAAGLWAAGVCAWRGLRGAWTRPAASRPGGAGGGAGDGTDPLLTPTASGGEGGGGEASPSADPGAHAERAAVLRLHPSSSSRPFTADADVILVVAGAAKAFPAGPAGSAGTASPQQPAWLPTVLAPTRTTPALRSAWLHARAGEVVGVVGSNGAGKTTLFRLIVGELEPDAGRVEVAGGPAVAGPLTRLPAWAPGYGRAGYCPQGAALPPDLSAVESVAALAVVRGVPRRAAGGAAGDLLAALGLPPAAAAGRPLSTLSGGQARRASVAAALIASPPLVVLDEPSTGLDGRARSRLWSAVRRACGGAAAVLVSSHRLDELDAACGRVAVLVDGHVAAVGAPAALRARYGGGVRVRVLPPPGADASAAAAAAAAALDASLDCITLEPGGRAACLRLGEGAALADTYERLEAVRAAGGLGGFSASGASLEDAFLALARGRRRA